MEQHPQHHQVSQHAIIFRAMGLLQVFSTANATAIVTMFVDGPPSYSSAAGMLSTTTGVVSGLNIECVGGSYVEVQISGGTPTGIGTGVIMIASHL